MISQIIRHFEERFLYNRAELFEAATNLKIPRGAQFPSPVKVKYPKRRSLTVLALFPSGLAEVVVGRARRALAPVCNVRPSAASR